MRITISKSKNSESFYINHSFLDEHGKNTSAVFRKLGTLAELSKKLNTDRDGVMLWVKQQAALATKEYKAANDALHIPFYPNKRIDKDAQRSFQVGYLFLQSILSSLRFDNICRNIQARHSCDYSIHAILSDLLYARILSPSSKRSSYAFAQTLLEQPKYELHQVYRALSLIAQESDYIQSQIYKNSNFLHQRNQKVLYYDCTNYYFEIEQEQGIKKYGKSKEHRPNPIVGMGLFMDGDGYPLAFDLNPGNQNEQKTLKPLEQKVIRDFEYADFIYCSDSGLGSQDNKLFNSMGGRAYVITQSLKKLKKDDKDIALNTKQYRRLGSNAFIDLKDLDESESSVFHSIYYKEIPLESKKLNETLLVTYSPKYRAYQAKIRAGQIERASKIISGGGKAKKNRRNPNDPNRFIKKTAMTQQGEIAEEVLYELDQEAIDNEAMYDGFYAVATNLDGDVSQIIDINKQRWQIEECFRIMKTDFEARPVYLQREDRIKAHFLTCFLSLLVYRLLDTRLEHQVKIGPLLHTLKKMDVCLLEGYGYMPTYKRTDITDKLHETFGFRTDTEIIPKATMRSIIKQSKSKKTLR